MSRFSLFAPVAAAAALALASGPAFAQTTGVPSSTSSSCSEFQFELANPTPGAMVSPGGYVLEGIALDTRATEGVGIDRVDFFLGNRDEGGLNLGTAAPMTMPGPLGTGSFQAILELPDVNGTHDLFAYAHSTVTGQEAIIALPITVGEDPTMTDDTASGTALPTVTESCTPAPDMTETPTMPSTTTPTTTPPSTTAPATTAPETTMTPAGDTTLHFEVSNPESGATLLPGAYTIEGVAMNSAATTGVGVDRVEVFWDNRDEGGLFLGSTIPGAVSGDTHGRWSLTVELPENMTGVHSLWFYVHSSVSDTWTAVEIPVTVE